MEITDSKELHKAQAHIWNHTFNYMATMALRCAVQLGIPDIISDHDRPVTLPELVTQLSIPPTKSDQLHRVMRLLVQTDFFILEKDDQGQEGYVGTYSSKLLSKKQHGNVASFVLFTTDPVRVTPGLSMADWFHAPESTAFEAVHGMTTHEYYGTHLDVGKMYNEAMASYSILMAKLLLKDLKPMVEGFGSLVDVGGNTGIVAKAISEAVPQLKCSVYDLPHVISDIKDKPKNITLVAGDMFELVPTANIILFKDVLIGCSDQECLKALMRCKEAISRENDGGKVIIVDTITNAGKGDSESITTNLCIDVYLMTCLVGNERTENAWKKIFVDAGFTSYKITQAWGLSTIIQVFP